VEGVSSFIVVFWSCVAALMQEMHGTLSFPLVCLVVALAVAFVLGWIGPAHFNPAVTATFAAFGYFPWPKLPLYALAQLAGSVLACLSVNGVMQPREEHFYGTVPRPAGHTRLTFLLEFFASAVLMVVIASAARSSAVSPAYSPDRCACNDDLNLK
jgi:aquaporin NIP